MHGAAGQGSGGNQYLLLTPDPSSVCLNCHAGVGAPSSNAVSTTDGSAMTPGGDFYWLTKTFTWIGGSVAGDAHGHNIVAWDYGFTADAFQRRAGRRNLSGEPARLYELP